MKRRFLSIFLASVMVMGLAVGCGSSGTESTDSGSESSDESSSDGKSISLLLTYSEEKTELYQCIDDFTAETGIEVEVQYMPLEDSRRQISTMVASNSLPDVMDVDNTDTQNYVEMGILADLTDRVESEIETDQYYEGVLESQQVDGKYYGLPFTANNLCLYYNQDLLTQAGVTEVPTTWDELLAACEQLKAIGVYGFGVAGNQSTDTTFQMWPFIWGAGADETSIDSDATVEMLEFYQTLVDNGYMSTEVVNYASGDNANQFTAGNTAMIIDGPWRLSSIQSDASFEYGVAAIPVKEEGAEQITVLGGHNFAITDGDNVDASWEFVKYMNQPEVMQKYSEAENYIPSRRDVCENSEYFKSDDLSTFVSAMEYAKPMPKKDYNSISDILIQMWQKVVLNQAEPADAAKEAGEAINALE
ncbi:sugar ABC transporter substrate-binding protein [Ruminococcus sp. CLA-AA-H200]|uniref:Sugar ABC transporter substrate-binding protein n=1 Tax=Ruminococcus turbiniformis TaxID=2881258 RepID=A0ABS8FW15_9FIRM|nr:sugar ABC transporter substrate-binding protein [Ruminococcus turbiniformis]MCC2253342.1 sugar ABC transporter substrate-binding protein [Ruminococcus turbiniformis]